MFAIEPSPTAFGRSCSRVGPNLADQVGPDWVAVTGTRPDPSYFGNLLARSDRTRPGPLGFENFLTRAAVGWGHDP